MAVGFERTINTVDSPTEGNPARVIVGGVKAPPGGTLRDERAWPWRIDRGPCGTGTSARTAALHARGQLRITGFHQFVLDPDDPLPEGFRIGQAPQAGSRF